MSYRNKTYVIFDGDEDMWAYAYMLGWKNNDKIDFNFYNAHDLKPLTKQANEETVKSRLRGRLSNTKQAIVLIGEKTKHLYRFVRWEMEVCKNLDIPMIAVNLNGLKKQDDDRCPAIIKNEYVVHIPFKMNIIKYALDGFPEEYNNKRATENGPRFYPDTIYKKLGL
jgi:Thoeris protein ThsB, TIR-like domain